MLGEGSFGKVFLGTTKNNNKIGWVIESDSNVNNEVKVAIKVLNLSSIKEREIEL